MPRFQGVPIGESVQAPAQPRRPRFSGVPLGAGPVPVAPTVPSDPKSVDPLPGQVRDYEAEHGFLDRTGQRLEKGARNLVAGLSATNAVGSGDVLNAFDAIDGGTAPSDVRRRLHGPDYDPRTWVRTDLDNQIDQYFGAAPDERRELRASYLESFAGSATRAAEHQAKASAIPSNPAAKAFIDRANAKDFSGAWDAFTTDPLGVIGQLGWESAPNMVPGLALTAATRNPVVGMGIGSFATEYGGSILDSMSEHGIDPTTPEGRARMRDPAVMDAIRVSAARKAGIIGAADAMSGGLAGKTIAPAAIKSVAAREVVNVPAQVGVQSTLGMIGEAGGQSAAGKDIQWGDVLAEGVGEAFGAPAEVLGVRSAIRQHQQPSGGAAQTPDPTIAQPVDSAPDHRADLERHLADERPIEDIARERQQAAERARAEVIQRNGLPEIGKTVTVAYPDGEIVVGRIEDAFEVAGPDGSPVAGVRVVPDDGPAVEVYATDATITQGTGERSDPVKAQTATDVDAAASQAAPPTEGQKEAGNYRKGHLTLQGMDITIETPRGAERSGVGPDGKPWSVEMPAHYGYVKRSEGADGDHVDVYVGDAIDSGAVVVVDQIDPDAGKFDEHKVLIGFPDRETALFTYSEAFSDGSGPDRIGAATVLSTDEFKAWLSKGDTTKPLAWKAADVAARERQASPVADQESAPAQPNIQEPPAIRTEEVANAEPQSAPEVRYVLPSFVGRSAGVGQNAQAERGQPIAPAPTQQMETAIEPPSWFSDLTPEGRQKLAMKAGLDTTQAAWVRKTNWPGITTRPHVLVRLEAAARRYIETATREQAGPATATPTEHPGLVIKSLETGKVTEVQPQGTVKPGEATSEDADYQEALKLLESTGGLTSAAHLRKNIGLSISDATRLLQRLRNEGKAKVHRMIGMNEAGNPVYEDIYGVRSITEGGVRIFETVEVTPQGPVLTGKRENRFKTIEEGVKDFIEDKRPEPPLSSQSYGTPEAPNRIAIAKAFASKFYGGASFSTIAQARQLAAQLVGGTVKPGTEAAKAVDEAIEIGVVMAARRIIGPNSGARSAVTAYDRLVDLYRRQPSLSVRTSTSMAQQAYSTPVPLAFVASHLAGIDQSTTVYEPTAGNGALLIAANPGRVLANELNSDRAAALREQGFEVAESDATTFRPAAQKRFAVVIANPPFGPVKDDSGKTKRFQIDGQYETAEIDHAIAMRALDAMRDDGRAVLIVGSIAKTARTDDARSDAYNAKAKREFYLTLYSRYNVIDHFTVAGELYEKQGAGWPVDVIVIDGNGKSERRVPAADVPRVYTSWDQLTELLEEAGHGRPVERTGAEAGKPADRVAEPRGGDGSGRPGVRQGGPDSGREPSAQGQPDGVRDGRADGQPADGRLAEAGRRVRSQSPAPEPAADTGAVPGQRGAGTPVRPEQEDDFDAIFDQEVERAFAPAEPPKAVVHEVPKEAWLDAIDEAEGRTPPRKDKLSTAAQTAASAVVETAKGLDDVAAGLAKLFGADPNRLGSGPGFDPETYAKAKPLFIEGVRHFKQAGSDVRETVRLLIAVLKDTYGFGREAIERMRPYLKRFVEDVQSGAVSLETGQPKKARKAERKPEEAREARQVAYEPKSAATGFGTLVPVNMQTSIRDALDELGRRVGDIDKFVARELGYEPGQLGEYFGAEQVDAIALALDNISRGAGFIIGDQTGIGKGRVVAAMIRFALKSGKTPVFVTEKPNLYADMYRDLRDIGVPKMLGRDLSIIMTNSAEMVPLDEEGTVVLKTPQSGPHNALLNRLRGEGKLSGFDVIFTTYTQMQTRAGEVTARMRFIEQFSRGGVVIFDESHNAGGSRQEGQEDRANGEDKMDRAKFAREIAGAAGAVFYSSATYAKRPEVMDLYFKTDMSLAVSDPSKLAEAINKGGIPMQQVVASMLAKAGQYIRRERSFDGVTYDAPLVAVDRKTYSRFSTVLKRIQVFSDTYARGAAKHIDREMKADGKSMSTDGSTGGAGADSTNFTSIMHNLIDQMLLAIKAEAAVEHALEALKRGEKPVITVSSTMGSFIEDFVGMAGLSPGDAINLDFNTMLDRYLERSRQVLIRRPFMKKGESAERHYLTDAELGLDGVRAFKAVKKAIAEIDLSALPISPIDHIRSRLTAAGFKVGEITGRKATIDYRKDGSAAYRVRGDKEVGIAARRKAITGFNNGDIDVMILNQAGSTGLSLHASEKFKNRQRRHMIIAQAEKNIDTHMQMLGRVHRTGQIVTPGYTQLVADVPAEKRPAAVLAKKMASLNANTTASRGGAMTAKDVPDFMNEYGDRVAAQIMSDNPDIHAALGSPLKSKDDAYDTEEAIRKVTGRIPLLPLEEQEALYEMIEGEYMALIEQLDAAGENALEAKTLDLNAKTVNRDQVVPPKGGSKSPFAEGVNVETVDVKRLGRPFPSIQVLEMIAEELGRDFTSHAETAKVDPSAVLESLVNGRGSFDGALTEVRREFISYRTAFLDELDGDKQRAAQEKRLNAMYERWVAVNRTAPVGQQVRLLTSNGNLYGVVVGIKRTGKAKNPVALGSWKVTVAIADASRQMTIPMSQIFTHDNQPTETGQSHVIIERVEKIGDTPVIAAFDRMQQDRREERVIVTGNLLAGFDHVHGRGAIINFTDSIGDIRQGILMPRDFQYGKWADLQPVAFANADQVLTFIGQAGGGKAAAVTADGALTIRMADGAVRFSVDAAKGTGGRYFLNRSIIDAAGRDFVKSGDAMRVEVPASRAADVIKAVVAVGGHIQATEHLGEARKIVGGKEKHSLKRSVFPPVPNWFFKWLGIAKKPVQANYDGLFRKYQRYAADGRTDTPRFSSPDEIAKHVEFVLANPDLAMPGTKGGSLLIVRRNRLEKAVVLEVKPDPQQHQIISVFTMTEGQLDAKIEDARRQGGSPAVLTRPPASDGQVARTRNLRAPHGAVQPGDDSSIGPDNRTVQTKELKRSIRAELAGIGLGVVAVRLADRIDAVVGGQATEADARYLRGVLDVSLRADDPRKAANHEVIHILREIGLFDGAEWRVLERAAQRSWRGEFSIDRDYAHLDEAGRNEEAVADAYAQWRSGGSEVGGIVRRAFTKVRRFFERVGNALRGNGFTSVDDIFTKAATGTATKGADAERKFTSWAEKTFGSDADLNALRSAADENRNALFSLFRDAEPMPDNLTIQERQDAGDLNLLKRYLFTPKAAFARWPALARLQRTGVDLEIKMSEFIKRLNSDLDAIKNSLADVEFEKLADVLFLGDAEAKEFTDTELAEMEVETKVADAYRSVRTLVDKIGRMVDYHRRSMLPKIRARKFAILKRMAGIRNMDDPEFRKLYDKRGRLRAKLRAGKGNPDHIAQQLDAIEKELNIRREDTDEYHELVQELDAIDAKLGQTSVRTRKGYVPHKFFGTWAVYRVEDDGEGGAVHKLVAGEHGFFPNRESAIAAAAQVAKDDEGANLLVRPVQFKFPASEATALTDAAYWRLLNRVSEAVSVEGQELRDLMQGVARRSFRRRIAGFTQKREGVAGYSRDFERVMRAHITEAVRYVALDRLKYDAIETMERMGLSPNRSENAERKVLQQAVREWFRDVNGNKQTLEDQIDRGLFEKPWASPWHMGLGSGALTTFAVFGVSSNPLISLALGSYVGYRFFRASEDGGAFKTRALMGSAAGDMSHLTLGMFLNVYSAMVNLTQTAINTWPILGGRHTEAGLRLTSAAVRSRLQGRPNRHWRLLERADIVSQFKYAEQTPAMFLKEERWRHWSMLLFNKAEEFNRAVAFLGAYHRAVDRGASEGVAIREARDVMIQTQHHYGSSAKPEVLRKVLLTLPAQFKNFIFQQIAFTAGLAKQWRSDPGALSRHILALFLLAGLLGFPGADLFDQLLQLMTGWSPIEEIKELALRAQASGELIGSIGNFFARGLPSLVGDDLSGRVGEGDFMPKSLRDLKGVWLRKFETAVELGRLEAGIADHARNLSTGIGAPLKALEAAANGMPFYDAILHPVDFFQALGDGRIIYSNPRRRGAMDFNEKIIRPTDLAKMAVGGSPVRVAQARDAVFLANKEKERLRRLTDRYMTQIVAAYRRTADNDERNRVIGNIVDRAREKGVLINTQQIRNAITNSEVPFVTRTLKTVPRQLRQKVNEMSGSMEMEN